jgi:hypothetical protein
VPVVFLYFDIPEEDKNEKQIKMTKTIGIVQHMPMYGECDHFVLLKNRNQFESCRSFADSIFQ